MAILKKSKQQKPKTVITALPNSWQLIKKSWFELATFWRPIAGVTVIYAILYFLFVMGLGFTSLLDTQAESGNALSDALYVIFGSVSDTYSGGSSDATVLLQYLLFIVASLALIWLLRKLQALKKVTVRDAYYQGASGIIPVLLVSVVLVLCLVPAALGSTFISVAIQAGGSGLEVGVISLIAGALLFLSVWLFVMFWPAFYIASLPQSRPIQALRSAKSLTKKRRISILRKMIILALILMVGTFAVLLPVALTVSAITPYIAYAVLFFGFAWMHIYLYQLYRSLI